MTTEEFNLLAGKVADEKATGAELSLYNTCFEQFQDSDHWKELAEDTASLKERSWVRISKAIEPETMVVERRFRISIAAAAAVIIFIAGFLMVIRSTESSKDTDIAPGRSGATIAFSDGREIQLNGAKEGLKIGKELTYLDGTSADAFGAVEQGGVEMLTASTSRGQTYRFTLPDGTNIWLNADSKITFPSVFAGKERRVKLSGEAYLEVVHNARQPFKVESHTQTVEDIGTAFNIRAYQDDEVVKTTILEGSAKVTAGDQTTGPLIAGQQAIQEKNQFTVKYIKAADEIDWKNGVFIFKSETVGDLMNRVARWYDIQVVFEDPSLADMKFSGTISRYDHIPKLLQILEATGTIKFEIKDRTINISK